MGRSNKGRGPGNPAVPLLRRLRLGVTTSSGPKALHLSVLIRRHLSQQAPDYLSEAERGKKNFSLTTLEKIGKALNESVSNLFSGKIATYSFREKGANKLAYLLREASPKEVDAILRTVKFMVRKK